MFFFLPPFKESCKQRKAGGIRRRQIISHEQGRTTRGGVGPGYSLRPEFDDWKWSSSPSVVSVDFFFLDTIGFLASFRKQSKISKAGEHSEERDPSEEAKQLCSSGNEVHVGWANKGTRDKHSDYG